MPVAVCAEGEEAEEAACVAETALDGGITEAAMNEELCATDGFPVTDPDAAVNAPSAFSVSFVAADAVAEDDGCTASEAAVAVFIKEEARVPCAV